MRDQSRWGSEDRTATNLRRFRCQQVLESKPKISHNPAYCGLAGLESQVIEYFPTGWCVSQLRHMSGAELRLADVSGPRWCGVSSQAFAQPSFR